MRADRTDTVAGGPTILGAKGGGRVVSMATLHVLADMTHLGRPHALVENVATLRAHQRRGSGRGVMQAVIGAARAADACKIMLLTGRAREAAGFYRAIGFGDDEKHGLVLRRQ